MKTETRKNHKYQGESEIRHFIKKKIVRKRNINKVNVNDSK
jgi:hypothetical protein